MKNSFLFILFCCFTIASYASDWSTHLHDNNRSAQTNESLQFPLHESWQFQSTTPQYAWDDPALQDFWHNAANLKPRMIFDRAHYTVAARNRVYFGSTVDDQIYCLDAETGAIVWRYYTNAPVRLPPTIYGSKIYAGSDDGYVYCLNAETGDLIWNYSASLEKRLLPGNERIISPWAIRTGVLIDDGTAYFASGMFPEENVFLCALNTESGKEIWKHEIPYSPQGNLLASEDHLFVPTGRSTPLLFKKTTGEFVKQLTGYGGSYAVLSKDQLIYGPGRTGQLSNTSTTSQIATFSGNHMIVTPAASYLHTDTELSAIDRNRYLQLKSKEANLNRGKNQIEQQLNQAKQNATNAAIEELTSSLRDAQRELSELQVQIQQCIVWNIPCAHSYSLIRAGEHLYAGGENTVVAYNAKTGKEVWRADINGKAYGLAVANQKLIVSTDLGTIHGFSINPVDTINQIASTKNSTLNHGSATTLEKDQKGYAVLVGWDQQEVNRLLTNHFYHIVVVEKDEHKVMQARTWLQDRNLYGKRTVVFQGSVQELGFTNYFANVVFANHTMKMGWDEDEITAIKSVVRPNGGHLYINTNDDSETPRFLSQFQDEFTATKYITANPVTNGTRWKLERTPLPNTGEWTHLYANAGNTASSGDKTVTQNMRLQWFGRPGPRQMIDRHLRPPSPLAKDGRLFIPANDQIIAADAYNGTVLWHNEVPGFRRVGIPYDTGNMVLTNQILYAVADKVCLGFDVATGKQFTKIQIPNDIQQTLPSHEWGYIAYTNGIIIGSAQPPDASRTELSREDVVEQYETFRPLVTSDAIFLHNVDDKTNHTYQNGRIINTSIAANSASVYFIECHSSDGDNNNEGRYPLRQLFADQINLVAIDLYSGEEQFRIPVDLQQLQHIVYLSCTEDVITITGSYNNDETRSVWYRVYAFDAKTGKELWRQDHENNRKGVGGDHGEQVHHPVVLNDKIIAEPFAYDLATGKVIQNNGDNWYLPSRGGCGTVSASASCLFYRNSNPMIFDFNTGGDAKKLSSVNRPGCWINMIPASGLVLIPEASSGCTCNFSIQTSMAFIPQK